MSKETFQGVDELSRCGTCGLGSDVDDPIVRFVEHGDFHPRCLPPSINPLDNPNDAVPKPKPGHGMFDYTGNIPTRGDLTGLPYTRCVWKAIEGADGAYVRMSREASSCAEDCANALLQAAAPFLYETLQKAARGEIGPKEMAEALAAVSDQEWADWVQNPTPSGAGLLPQDILDMATSQKS